MSKEASAKSPLPIPDRATVAEIAKIFAVSDQKDIAPVWGHILLQKGLGVVLKTSLEKRIEGQSIKMSDKVRNSSR